MVRRKHRKLAGMTLLEMVVSIGLSGIFVVMLSGMLSETLALATSSQNDLVAATAADSLIESARAVPYDYFSNYPLSTAVNLPVNFPATPSTIRALPVQLDLGGTNEQYGVLNISGTLNSGNAWSSAKSNSLQATATETFQPQVVNGLNAYLVTVTVSYQSVTHSTKTLTRTTYVFQNGAAIQ